MSERLDVVGIGVGPANLSLAALLNPHTAIRAAFFDRTLQFQWHPGLMFPEAAIQVPYVKDLVTLVDPTSRFSFLSFLSHANRLYAFVNANFPQVLRREFSEYYDWVCSQLPSVHFNFDVEAVTWDGSDLVVHTQRGLQKGRNVVLGTGRAPSVPECMANKICSTVFHASTFRSRNVPLPGKRLIIVGGGQTGAEVLLHVLLSSEALPSEVHWVSRRYNFLPLDESPFTNELFVPAYSDYFFQLQSDERSRLLDKQELASDGISQSLLQTIYRRLYELRYCDRSRCGWSLRPGRETIDLTPSAGAWLLTLRHRSTGMIETVPGDVIVVCTGYREGVPPYLEPIRDRINLSDGRLVVDADFAIDWDGPSDRKIYAQNAARVQRGIADPNLSLIAWRSAKIANSIAGRPLYNVQAPPSFVCWSSPDGGASEQRQREPLLVPVTVSA
jgi:lysine N6-hydroxylase